MVKVLFIYPSTNTDYWMPLGIASLSAYLKKNGHHVGLYDCTNKDLVNIKNELNEQIVDFMPDLIAFSCVSAHYEFALVLAEYIKQHHNIKILFGGIHPTIVPDKVISIPSVDMVCIGEGELALLELVTKIEEGKYYFDTQNFWFKNDNNIIKNDVRPFIEDLDTLPFPDRTIFDSRHVFCYDGLTDKNSIYMVAGRGCPYDCFYCCNNFLAQFQNPVMNNKVISSQ